MNTFPIVYSDGQGKSTLVQVSVTIIDGHVVLTHVTTPNSQTPTQETPSCKN